MFSFHYQWQLLKASQHFHYQNEGMHALTYSRAFSHIHTHTHTRVWVLKQDSVELELFTHAVAPNSDKSPRNSIHFNSLQCICDQTVASSDPQTCWRNLGGGNEWLMLCSLLTTATEMPLKKAFNPLLQWSCSMASGSGLHLYWAASSWVNSSVYASKVR